jgi:alpha-1,3-glucosyltransferase
MRATALASECFTYVPAAIVLARRYSRLQAVSSWESSIALVAILMQPATMLIDHGHFQYNTVMLGFLLASMSSMMARRLLWSCVFFVASLGFKQMALFYAPAIFAYLLGSCLNPRFNLRLLLAITLTTLASFALLFLPLILGALYDSYRGIKLTDIETPPLLSTLQHLLPSSLLSPSSPAYPILLQLTQSIHRIFPFSRGLFEDKVANLWCTLHTFHKLTPRYTTSLLSRASLLTTLLAALPPCTILLLRPHRSLLPWALAATAWAFFLCSFQVHEKNVLLPLLPMTVLLAGEGGLSAWMRAWVGWGNMLGCWTLFPLLKRDGLRVPYAVLTLLWSWLMGLPPTSLSAYRQGIDGATGWPAAVLHLATYAAMIVWHVGEEFVPPPKGKPDLWVVLNVLVGAAGFGLCYLWCLWGLLVKSGVLNKKTGWELKKTQ